LESRLLNERSTFAASLARALRRFGQAKHELRLEKQQTSTGDTGSTGSDLEPNKTGARLIDS